MLNNILQKYVDMSLIMKTYLLSKDGTQLYIITPNNIENVTITDTYIKLREEVFDSEHLKVGFMSSYVCRNYMKFDNEISRNFKRHLIKKE